MHVIAFFYRSPASLSWMFDVVHMSLLLAGSTLSAFLQSSCFSVLDV